MLVICQNCGRKYGYTAGWRLVDGERITIDVPPGYWTQDIKSNDEKVEKPVEKQSSKWPAVISAMVLAVSLGVGVTVLEKDTTIHLDLPIYADDAVGVFREPITSDGYDEMAKFDALIFGHETMLSPYSVDLVDSVRARNPDFIYLTYFFVFGCREGWGGTGGFYGSLYDMIDRNGWWLTDWKGDVVRGGCTTGDPACTVRFFNCGAAGLADSLAAFCVGYLEKQGNLDPHTGVFLDWITIPFPQWPMRTPVDSLDFNKNGIPRCDDPGDDVQQALYPEQLATAFRSAASKIPTFLVVPNGNAFYVQGGKYASLFDGGMFEMVNLYYPQGKSQWAEAMKLSEKLDNSRVDPPLLIFQGGENDSIGYPSEVQASLASGACNFLFGDDFRRLDLGRRMMSPVWSGDTVSTFFINDEGNQYVARAVAKRFIWPYLITSFDGADTLSRGGGWPRAVPESGVEAALGEFDDYLRLHYGEPIGLSVVSEWASTTRKVLEACEVR